jgi:endonuclease/exonuclease/phosphatase family metal-dependent hydrolase
VLRWDWHPLSGLDFTVASYNVYLRPRYPIFLDGQWERSGRIPSYLKDPAYDAVALCEVFDGACRRRVLAELGDHYPYRTPVLGGSRGGWKHNGGVMLLSRWPIERQGEELFGDAAHLDDRLANKGVVYACVRKLGERVHVFAMHANAHAWAIAARAQQFGIVRRFMAACSIPRDEPVILAGDFNVHRGDAPEYEGMLDILGACSPEPVGHDSTYDPATNTLARGPARLFLDYVLTASEHRRPWRAVMEVLRVRCAPWRQFAWQRACEDLSDHYPVVGRFSF